MLIAISSEGKTLESNLNSRFGRSTYFIIYNTESKTFDSIDNTQTTIQAQGAGIQTAQMIADLGVQIVITGVAGPKAFRVLKESKIEVFTSKDILVKDAIAKYQDGTLIEQEQ